MHHLKTSNFDAKKTRLKFYKIQLLKQQSFLQNDITYTTPPPCRTLNLIHKFERKKSHDDNEIRDKYGMNIIHILNDIS